MKNRNLLKYAIRIAIAFIATCVMTILVLLILHNLEGLAKLCNDNRYVIVFFEKLKKCEMKIPYMLIITCFLLYCIPLLLYKKERKIIVFFSLTIITIIGILSIILLTTFDDYFFFQIIKNLKESINEFQK